MSKFWHKILTHRFGPLFLFAIILCCISLVTRLALLMASWSTIDKNPLTWIWIFLIGLFYDLVVSCFAGLPIALFCWLTKDSWYKTKISRWALYGIMVLAIFLLLFNAGSEWFFWDEFSTRYNFIAVDYLVYTNEVIGNIFESYNMPAILAGVFIAAFIIFFFIKNKIKPSQQVTMRFAQRSKWFGIYLLLGIAAYFLVSNKWKNISNNNYSNELGGNGLYEFGAAFWNNELDYNQFYLTLPEKEAFGILHQQLQTPDATNISDSFSTRRKIINDSPFIKRNVVLISVESFSGDFMKIFGDTIGMTPHLDSLVQHSLFFNNFYASGTRTVRGLEALSLSIPPTPGQSIVRRPNNENMFTIGSVFKKQGYDCKYIYGGNGFFDNMNYFFENNGYEIVDIKTIKKETPIHHETTWGVADEDLFTQALKECDKSFAAGKNFFSQVMTVSNHRPYTYPDGRIDIPSSVQSREGAMKYCDWAIDDFLKRAQQKPWFNNTLFVIVADHCAKSAGKTDLPVSRYHIPCFIYAPNFIKPQIFERPTGQIDLLPTIAGMLNMQYDSKFFGYDMMQLPPNKERLFIGTYQLLGYIKGDTLTVLEPQQKATMYKADFKTGVNTKIAMDSVLLKQAIAYYQTASYLFKHQTYTP